MIECQICKGFFGRLTGKHLASHNISAEGYRQQFPGHLTSLAKPWSEERRAKARQARLGYKHSEETKAKIGAGNLGKKMSTQAVARQKASYQQFLAANGGSPQKGYKRSDEFKARMSEIANNRSPQMIQDKVEQMWAARRGSKASPEQKARYRSGRLKYMAENPDKLPNRMFNTVPEQEFGLALDQLHIPYTKSFHLGNRVFDFLLGDKVLVEIDGPYHRRLGFYLPPTATEDEIVTKLAGFIQRDREKDKTARSLGYLVYRIPVGQHLPANWKQILIEQGFVDWNLM